MASRPSLPRKRCRLAVPVNSLSDTILTLRPAQSAIWAAFTIYVCRLPSVNGMSVAAGVEAQGRIAGFAASLR